MRKSERGFTLMEIVAALFLISLVAVPLAKTFMDSYKFQAKSQLKTEANKVAQYVAEQLKDGKNAYYDLEPKNGSEVKYENFTAVGLGNLADKYSMHIKITNVEENKDIAGSTPTEFAYTVIVDEAGNFKDPTNDVGLDPISEDLSISRSGSNITVKKETLSSETYNFLLENKSDKLVDFLITKETPAIINVYTKGENISAKCQQRTQVAKEYNTINLFHLGDKKQVTSKTKILCDATITVTSKTDSTNHVVMNTTFTMDK